MPTEIFSPTVEVELQESPEVRVDGAEFCLAYQAVCDLQRNTVASLMQISPRDLSAGAMKHHGDEHQLQRADRILASPKVQAYIEESIQNDNGKFPPVLRDEQMRSYIIGLARAGVMGGMIEGVKNGGGVSRPNLRVYKERLVDMNHTFVQLIDSEFGRSVGFTRHDLRLLLSAAFGAGHDRVSHDLVSSLEVGLAVEVATKRYIEAIGSEFGISVRFSTVQEDSKKVDLMCVNGHKSLGIDVKNGDKNSGKEGEARAYYSPIEELDLHEYRVRELYPAMHTAIGDNFEIRADAYKKKIQELLTEFSALP